VPLEHPFVLQRQCRIGGAPDLKRKTAGYHAGARLFAGKDSQFDH
jgi:hypothetical protein